MYVIPVVVICPNCSSTIYYVPNKNSITCTNCSEVIEVEIEAIREAIEEPVEQSQPTPIEQLQSQISQQNAELISQITNLQKQLNILPPITEPISLQDYQINKIYELTLACNQHILNGFYSSCRGIEEFYSCSQLDQDNIKGYIALLGVKPDLDNIIWKSASETLCTPFTAGQMIILGSDMMHHVQDNIYKFELLRNQVMECISIESVGAITWESII